MEQCSLWIERRGEFTSISTEYSSFNINNIMTNKILIMWKKTSPQHNNIVRIKVYSSQERSIIIIYISYRNNTTIKIISFTLILIVFYTQSHVSDMIQLFIQTQGVHPSYNWHRLSTLVASSTTYLTWKHKKSILPRAWLTRIQGI